MKQTSLSACLWMTAAAAPIVGACIVWTLCAEQRDDRMTLDSQLRSLTDGNGPARPERWDNLAAGRETPYFSPVRLQPGDRPMVAPDVETAKRSAVEPAPMPDLAAIRERVVREFEESIELRHVWYVPREGWATLALKHCNNTLVDLVEGQNILAAFAADIERQPRIAQALPDATVVEIGMGKALFSVASAELAAALERIETSDIAGLSGIHRFESSRFLISLSIAPACAGADEFWRDAAKDCGSKLSGVQISARDLSMPRDDLAEIVKNFVPENRDDDSNDTPRETRLNEDGSVRLGLDDVNQPAFDALSRYATIWIDPRTKRAGGIRVADDLPAESLAWRAGARAGDIVRSINGQKIASMHEIRRVAATQLNGGAKTFNVVLVRNGVERTVVIHAPGK